MRLWKRKQQIEALPFQAMLEHIVVPTFALGPDGRVVYWNPACAALTGIAAAEVLGTRDHWRGFYRAQRPCLADLALQGTAAQAGSLYAQSKEADGSGRMVAQNWCDLPARGRRYLRIDAGQIRDVAGNLIVVVETLQDLTEVKDAEAAMLAEREAVAQQQAMVVKGLASGLAALAAGDLVSSIDQAFPAQYEALRRDFNAALAELRETVVSFRGNAGGVREGAGDVMKAADELAHRTAHQEDTLRQTSAALESLSATVRQTSTHAQQAREVAATARGDAERSAPVVRKAVEAMGEIEQSSQQIGNIIGVIDEIAFQTNLLALNAGVEAARAGDAGRGFAVVASEVRALAQRSAEAAREIKHLVSASGSQVEAGVKLVGEAGTALGRIVSHVEELSTLMMGIATSTQNQADGLQEVNQAMARMEDARRQNALMVQRATDASHALADEATALEERIGRFRVGETSARTFAALDLA